MAFLVDAALSTFFDSLFSKFFSSGINFVTEKQVRNEITSWESTLKTLRAVLADAEERKMRNQAVKIWLADLQDLAYDIDDILDEFATEALGRKLTKAHQASTSKAKKFLPSFNPTSVILNYKMMSKIKEITARLECLVTRKSQLQLHEIDVGKHMTTAKRSQTSSLVNEATVRGRDRDKKAILDLLFKENAVDAGVSVIPIVGMGGIGKTTLAQLVYNDRSITDHFDLKVWVCVSDEFDVIKITKTILQSVTSKSCDENDLNSLQVKLKEQLSSKKFLLVLDDVWSENYEEWTKLRSPFDAGNPGSKIMVTTRSSNVSSIMRTVADHSLQILSHDDSLFMLAHHALERDDFTGHPKLEEIGLDIVKKCGSLPLAIKTIGGLLRTKVNHEAWNNILKSDIWNLLAEKSEIAPALLLSYNYLPSQLKQCFAYCSLVPKDYEFTEEEIVLLWMAEGFLIGGNTKREIKDLGNECFEELVARSFFQASGMNKSLFVMHDLINDLAQFVAREMYFKREKQDVLKGPTSRTRHLSYIVDPQDGIRKFEKFFEAKSLRTYLPFEMLSEYRYYISKNVLDDLLPRLKYLRVLSLKRYFITEIPSFIENLNHLRFLDFSYTLIKGLPDSICALYNLETLLLRYCEKIEKLPKKIGILENLCHLDIIGANSIKEMPSGIGKLTNLQVLSNFIVGDGDGLNIREMQNLSNLKGQLCISELHNVAEAQCAHEAKLSCKLDLDSLELKWSTDFSENLRRKEVEKEVLSFLQPHKDIKEVAIMYYCGIEFPNWVEDDSFKNLQVLRFVDCQNCTLLPAVGKLPLLKDLYVKGMKSVISIGNEFYGIDGPNVFPSLETLQFEDMLEWKEWKLCGVGKQDKIFGCLRELSIQNCPKLEGILPHRVHSLEKLVIRQCQELVVSVSDLPTLCKLIINGCKVVLGSYDDLWAVKEVFLFNISKFACGTKEMKMEESTKIENLQINGSDEGLASLWQTKWGWLSPLRSLRTLRLENCPQVMFIGAAKEEEEDKFMQLEIPQYIENVILQCCHGLEIFSDTFHHLTCLTNLKIEKCPKLVSLQTDSLPPTLRTSRIEDCEKLECLLDDKENMNFCSTSLLESLNIRDCGALKSLSSSGKLPVGLKDLYVGVCPVLECIAQEIGGNTCLRTLSIFYCEKLECLLDDKENINFSIQSIWVEGCGALKSLSSSDELPVGLKKLHVQGCPKLERIAQDIGGNTRLETIELWDCGNVKYLAQGLDKLNRLQEIDLNACPNLVDFPGALSNHLQRLRIRDSTNMVQYSIGERGLPTNLTTLIIVDPNTSKAVMEWGLHRLTTLTHLCIFGDNCSDAVSFPREEIGMKLPPSLRRLTIWNFQNIRKLSSNGFQNLSSLQDLFIFNCPKLKSIPSKEMLPSLLRLRISGCPELKKRCKRDKGKQWPNIAHIPFVTIDGRFIYW